MTNNDVLRRLRYTFDFNEHKMVSIFALADTKVTPAQVTSWLKKDEDPEYENCSDTMLAIFLNGLISEKRGKKEGEQPKPETRINNNIIFMKLKIALNLQADDVLAILALAGLKISKHELSAFFRRPDHKHFRKCKDQVLRNFMMGLQIKYRGALESKSAPKPASGSLYKSK
jgi:uncharacterized protein YehS (DUF1456 family)